MHPTSGQANITFAASAVHNAAGRGQEGDNISVVIGHRTKVVEGRVGRGQLGGYYSLSLNM